MSGMVGSHRYKNNSERLRTFGYVEKKRYRRRYGQCNIKVLEGVLENICFLIVHKSKKPRNC